MAYSTAIGETQEKASQPVVAGFILGIVTQAEVAAATSDVNNTHLSGKKKGSCYLMKLTAGVGYDIIVAAESEKTSAWIRISDAGAAPITPA